MVQYYPHSNHVTYILRDSSLTLHRRSCYIIIALANYVITLNTRNFYPAVSLQNLPKARRKSSQSYGNKHHLLYLSLILILQSADCEKNPGPRTPKYPCMIYSKAIKWNQRAVACDNCEGWYHAECMNMNSQIYTALTKPAHAVYLTSVHHYLNHSTSMNHQTVLTRLRTTYPHLPVSLLHQRARHHHTK